jgi:hypothetical protein
MHCTVLLARGNIFLAKVDSVKTCCGSSSTAAIFYFISGLLANIQNKVRTSVRV